MDTLQGMRVFARVAQRAAFARAARELGMSPAAVTKHVAALEARLGARLLDRTTRTVSVTEAGRVYLERCLACLQAFDDAEASVGDVAGEPHGRLRVSAPIDLQRQLPAIVAAFTTAHPRVQVDLRLSNRVVDLVDEHVDLAIRVAGALDGDFVARPLARFRLRLLAAPAYLRAHGRPRRPADLAAHRAIVFVEPRPWDHLTLRRRGRRTRARLTAAVTTNVGEVVRGALLTGAFIGVIPEFLVRDDVDAGRLEPLLDDWDVEPDARIWAVYPHRRFVSAAVRAFVEALRAGFTA